MPVVHIDLMTGRPQAAIADMMGEVAAAIARTLDAPIESVRIVVNEMAPHQYSVGGKPWPVVLEERRAAAERD
jgi:4-oxalocrotonate tautomerase family enzyme